MRIDRLQIKNFRCFDNRTFVLDKRFTLLVGVNGSGKTALLDALAVAAGSALLNIPDAKGVSIYRRDVRRVYRKSGETGQYIEYYPARIEVNGLIAEEEQFWSRELRTEKGKTSRAEANNIRFAMTDLVRRSRNDEDVVFPFIGYYGTGRLWVQQRPMEGRLLKPTKKETRYVGYRNCLEPSSSAQRMVAWVKRLALIQAQNGKKLETLNAVYQVIAKCVEGARSVIFDFQEDDIVVEFKDSHRLPLWSLSDGQRTMAATVADIAMRCAELNPHLRGQAHVETPGIVLIDEIDLHLHPRWQRSVVQDLSETFPRLQFIATTHSPFIIQSMRLGAVTNLDGEVNDPEPVYQQSIEDVTENIMGVELPQRSKRFWNMLYAAEEYFEIIEHGEDPNSETVKLLRLKLDELEEPFSEDPAYLAFLRMYRKSSGLE